MIDNDQLAEEVASLVSRVVKMPREKIGLEMDLFSDLGVDSLRGVEIFAMIDKKYGLDVPENKLKNVHTVRDLIALVRDLLAQ